MLDDDSNFKSSRSMYNKKRGPVFEDISEVYFTDIKIKK